MCQMELGSVEVNGLVALNSTKRGGEVRSYNAYKISIHFRLCTEANGNGLQSFDAHALVVEINTKLQMRRLSLNQDLKRCV